MRVTYPSSLHQVGYHDDDLDPLFPDHPPEGVECGRQRALTSYVGPALLEAVNIVGVDVFTLLLSGQRLQQDTRVVVCTKFSR